jgi:MscS family membrane protein
MHRSSLSAASIATAALAWAAIAAAQPARPAETPQPAPPQAVATDPLGRSTPRGTVVGFLNAARRGENELASQYLHTQLTGQAAAVLAHQLFVVLDARLPARLTQISDAAEGSRANPLKPDEELIGTVEGLDGRFDVVLNRVSRGENERIWLFSQATLESIEPLYQEVTATWGPRGLPRFMSRVRFLEWVAVLIGLPLVYLLTVLLNRLLTPVLNRLWRRLTSSPETTAHSVLPIPARLLLLALVTRWVLSSVSLSLFVRQFWSNAAGVIIIASVVWLVILLNGEIEQIVQRRLSGSNVSAAISLLRLIRRSADLLVLFAGLLAMLRFLAIDATPALAGLGVGGIAVALAAQKTLENVIAGASLIFDQAVRVGDFLKMGDILGTVDHIGLRSTRIRTLDRTVVSVPNSQIANVSLETISARDKFWLHPIVALRYETSSDQLRTVLEGIRGLLLEEPLIDTASIRVRFFRLGTFSLDVEVFAYLRARDWSQFLEVQERLLLGITDVVDRAGTALAYPHPPPNWSAANGTTPVALPTVVSRE